MEVKVKCERCGYEGKPALVYILNPLDHTDIIPEAGCPNCKTDIGCILYEENTDVRSINCPASPANT